MTGREAVTPERLRAFLEALGREFQHPVRLYLSGGETLVWRGLRGTTKDLDVTYAVDPKWHGAWISALRELMLRTQTSVEEAGPGDIIPLPPGAEGRAEFVGCYGTVDVFLFDPYSVALSKISRGHAQDLQDVRAMLGKGILDAAELRRLFEVILPAYERSRVRADPAEFRANLDRVLGGA